MKREISAGGVVFKKSGDEVLWLIIKSKPSADFPKDRYQFPKGWIEEGESAEVAALREVKEESGITAEMVCKLDTVKFTFTFRGEKIFKIITYYLMEYVSGEAAADGVETEEIFWLPHDQALKIMTISSGKGLLQKAAEIAKTLAD